MKRFLFICFALLIFSTLTAAQEEGYLRKGMSRLSGAAAFSWKHQDGIQGADFPAKNNNYQFSLSPSYSRLITNNLELGGVFSLMYRKTASELSIPGNPINLSTDYLSIGLGPAVRYYFTTDNLVPFVGASYIFSSMGQQGRNEKQTMTNLNLGAGLDYFISDNTALEPAITNSFYWYEGAKINRLNIGIGINYFIK